MEQDVQKNSADWFKWGVGAAVFALLTWYFVRQTPFSADSLRLAFRSADWTWVGLGLLTITLTNTLKAWRWQLLFQPAEHRPTFAHAFWAIHLNQFANLVIFGRVGEIARAYTMRRYAAQAVGTIVVEKSLEMIFSGLLVLLLLPFVVLPREIRESSVTLLLVGGGFLLLLVLIALRSAGLVQLIERLGTRLPSKIGRKIIPLLRNGLQGLQALRSHHTLSQQLALSCLITFCYIVTPALLFRAVDLPFSLFNAALVHIWVSLVTIPPSTPGKMGVFEWATVTLLQQRGVSADSSLLLSYAVLLHLVVILPPLLLGGLATLTLKKIR